MKRSVFFFGFVFIVLTSLALTAIPSTILAQIDPTNQQQTNEADLYSTAVQQLFNQTGTAVATITAQAQFDQTATAHYWATHTVETHFSRAQTATAVAQNAPTQTIQALLNRAMTATAVGDAPNYADYELIDMQEFELIASFGRSGAHLSPDGTKFIHFDREICIYELRGTSWQQDHCFAREEESLRMNPEDMFWSPDGRYLTMSTYDHGLRLLYDTDIQILDLETDTVINLTDDGSETSLIRAFKGNFDLSPRWLDADTIAFIRYASIPIESEASIGERLLPPAIYTVDVPTDGTLHEPELLAAIPSPYPLSTYALTVDGRRGRAAFNFDTRNSGAAQGIWQVEFENNDLDPLFVVTDLRMVPLQLDYSRDGRYLLTFNQTPQGMLTMRTVSTETGDLIEIDPRFPTLDAEGAPLDALRTPMVVAAGWSPRGSALVYVVRDPSAREDGPGGLYITRAPGEPGTRILEGRFYAPTCCQRMPIQWADNDIIMIGRGAEPGVLLIQVGVR